MPSPSKPPVLSSARLIFKPHTVQDFEDCYAMWSDPDITRFIGGRPSSREEVWLRLLRYAGLWSLLGLGYWVIRERHSGVFLGEAGLADFHRDIEPSLGAFPELGFALTFPAWGKGYATEAAQAIIGWSNAKLRPARLVAIADTDNQASIRILTKCGFVAERTARYKDKEVVVYVRKQVPTEMQTPPGQAQAE